MTGGGPGAGRPGPAPEPGRAGGSVAYRLRGVDVALGSGPAARRVLDDVTFDVRAGEVVGVVGRSGSGKTTLLRVLGGLVPPCAGELSLFGRPVTGPRAEAVLVFQDYGNALLPWRSVARNTALGLGRLGADERRHRVAEALRLVGLADRGGDFPRDLSGGMAQRVQIARALAVRPEVLLMDEPFGALDALTKAALQDVLLDVHARTGTTVVFVTHDLDEAIYLADRVLTIAGAPGTVTLELPTPLPRPRHQLRTRESADYLRLRHRLGERLGAGRG